MKKALWTSAIFFIALSTAAPVAAAPTGPITGNLQAVVAKVLTVLRDPAYAGPDKKPERNVLIHTLASGTFDWEEMARRTLGHHWRDLNAGQKQQFIDTFVGFLERTYISKIAVFLQGVKGFTAQNILYLSENVEDDRYAIVETMIQLDEKRLPLNYKLIRKKGRWVVYDITIEGVGLVANYRAQFNEILANGSFETLLAKLTSKQDV